MLMLSCRLVKMSTDMMCKVAELTDGLHGKNNCEEKLLLKIVVPINIITVATSQMVFVVCIIKILTHHEVQMSTVLVFTGSITVTKRSSQQSASSCHTKMELQSLLYIGHSTVCGEKECV